MPPTPPIHTTTIGSLVNRPMVVALAVIAAGIVGGFFRDSVTDGRSVTRTEVRVTELEAWAADHKRLSVTRDEFNRLDVQVQGKVGREELAAFARRIDDVRADLAEIKSALILNGRPAK